MSLVPPGTVLALACPYIFAQVAVTCAALYDHALSLGREVELIWMKPTSLITVLYVAERYLGDAVLIAGLYLCFSAAESEKEASIRLFQFRAWGALVYSWATQATMQLRIYAMYRRSRRVLLLLLSAFLGEIVAIAFIIWQTIGPSSPLQVVNAVPKMRFCMFTGIDTDFVYIFIPFLCFEFLLFLLAARVFLESMRRNWQAKQDKVLGENSFMSILARDSLCYFFVNLVACAVVMGLWQGVTAHYANICVPFVMLLEVLVGTRLILDFRERYARPDDPVILSGRCSSLYFRGDDMQINSTRISVRCDVETIVVADEGN